MIDADTIHDYLNGDLDENKVRELAEWLLAAPENRVSFRREVALATSLEERAAAVAQIRSEKLSETSAHRLGGKKTKRVIPGARPAQSPRQRRSHQSRLMTSFLVVTALAAVAVIGVIPALKPTPMPSAPAPVATTATTPTPPQLPASHIVIGDLRGSVSVTRDKIPLKAMPDKLLAGDQVQIGAQAAVRLEMDDGHTRIWAESDTTFMIASIRESRDRAGTKLDMLKGKLLIEAAPQPENMPLRIRSPHSEAEVIGTVLSFEVTPKTDLLKVAKGVVAYGILTETKPTQVIAGGFGEWDGSRISNGKFTHELPAAVTTAKVSGFSLIDDNTNRAIPGYEQMTSGSVVDLAGLHGRKLNIRANVIWPGSDDDSDIVFHYDDHRNTEGSAPYSLLKYSLPLPAWVPPGKFANGIHVLSATPYSPKLNANSPANPTASDPSNKSPGQSATIIFTVINSTP